MRGAIFLILALVILSLKVNAINVVSDYLVNSTLELIEGSSKIYSIRLQNPTDNDIGMHLDYDSSIMKVIDYKEVYTLPPKETAYRILFNVTAPKKPGLYKVGYTVGEVEAGSSGGLPLRLKISRNFNLRVIEEPKMNKEPKKTNKPQINYNYVAYAAIVLAFLLYLLIKKRYNLTQKREKSKKFL